MNWFTRTVVEGSSAERKQELLDKDGGCEHVEKDVNLGTILRAERDSFGPVGTYLCCKACDEKATEEEDNEERCCKDCKQMVKKKEGAEWRWYDFYAPQGDEPIFICNACRLLPKHLDRVARDDRDRAAELGEVDDEPIDDDPECGVRDDEEQDTGLYTYQCHTCQKTVEEENVYFDHQHNFQCLACNDAMNTPK